MNSMARNNLHQGCIKINAVGGLGEFSHDALQRRLSLRCIALGSQR
jgi:hypothetical protein